MFSNPTSNLAKLNVGNAMKVVDLGAGSGFYTFELAKMVGASGRVYAVDVVKGLLERIRSTGLANGLRNIEVVWGNCEKIGGTKLGEAVADRVVASNILFQIEKPDEFVLEIKRILKIGGKVLIVDWNEMSTMGPKNIVNSAKARMLFEKAGFKFDQSFDAGDHHYGLVMIRQ